MKRRRRRRRRRRRKRGRMRSRGRSRRTQYACCQDIDKIKLNVNKAKWAKAS